MNYYIVACRSGVEDKVKKHLDRFFEDKEERDVVVTIPVRRMIDRRRGKPLMSDQPLLPGYLLLSSENELDSYVQEVKGLYGSYGFLKNLDNSIILKGQDHSYVDWVLRNEGVIKPSKVIYRKGEPIRIVQGPMKDFMGKVVSVDYRRSRVKVEFEFAADIRKVDLPVEFIAHE
jgi:transcriptional antiterminator NusG